MTLFKKIRCHTHGTVDDLIHSKVVCDTQSHMLREIELHADRMDGLLEKKKHKKRGTSIDRTLKKIIRLITEW